MAQISVKIAKGLENNPDAEIIRKKIFICEQGFKNEFDETDKTAVHCVIYVSEKPAATGRIFFLNGEAHIGRVAVLKEYRGAHLGKKVILTLEEYARENDFGECVLSAQKQAEGFYAKLGYKAFGDIFFDEHCPHIMMKKEVRL